MSVAPHRGVWFFALAAGLLGMTKISAAEPANTVPVAAEPNPGQARRLPARMVEALADRLPKYVPPKPREAGGSGGTAGESEAGDDVLHLPGIKVTAQKGPKIEGFAMLSEKGRLDLALKSAPGLRVLPVLGLNDKIAMAMLQEEREASARRQLVADGVRMVDPEDKKTLKLLRGAASRPNTDWATGNPGRR